MKPGKLLRLILLVLTISACRLSTNTVQSPNIDSNSTDSTGIIPSKIAETKKSLAGRIFTFAPELDTATCRAFGECDCCTSDILFLTDSIFLMIDYCVDEDSYSKGLYSLINSKLTLRFDGQTLREEIEKKYSSDSAAEPQENIKYINETIQPATANFHLNNCAGSMYFNSDEIYGTENKQVSLNTKLKALEKAGILAKLHITL